ncbi:hypothetical protein SAMN05428945_1574 [Streptomyces sp. 2224.1]|uniref:hypothetical protein n=1 Tax=unclassified Streptomyces TaxID=2593676 RepID=UPI000884FDBE|nr:MULTISPECIES: hypothetical protein [unclassified Streptomyces]PBC83792.1 hypothetical protein BX261_3749 [Streptomyces sp. 2321.6]SDR38645.1 hypothetical protein SAMN05216511_3449 [Streptomyces sp. KS_16]SEB93423.1 hypothetical protein SAMN05428945_1574 [Streptomyces sp. 2224.1]SED09065.1 hypothetical protein SAMN05428940_3777 [Streptomyces sp. 2133.1]SNC69871.1 hypothetical protein SAMN06272741_3743 [Streptomyces sp. 2114.4]
MLDLIAVVFRALVVLAFWGLVTGVVGLPAFVILRLLDPGDRWRVRAMVMFFRARVVALVIRGWVRVVHEAVRVRARSTGRYLAWARRGFGPAADRLFPRSYAVRTAVARWYESIPGALLLYVVKAYVLLQVTLNAGALVTGLTRGTVDLWERSGQAAEAAEAHGAIITRVDTPPDVVKGVGGGGIDPLASIVATLRRMVEAIADTATPYLPALADPLGRPRDAATAVVALVLTVAAFMAVRAVLVAVGFLAPPTRYQQAKKTAHLDPTPRFAAARKLLSLRVGEARRNRPVVDLVRCLARVGYARRHYLRMAEIREPLAAPRVHLAEAERVVWSAWRTRHTAVRGVQAARFKRHAADVVGALRAVEARQDSDADTKAVFDEMARLLAKIAERYAQGRTLALLDPDDLEGVTAAVNREWVRLVILGAGVCGVAVGGAFLDLPDQVTAQVTGVSALVLVALLYGVRLAPTDLMDVVRGQSRK